MVTKNTREVAATLLKLAKTSSDPAVAAGFVERAADLKERMDDEGLRSRREPVASQHHPAPVKQVD